LQDINVRRGDGKLITQINRISTTTNPWTIPKEIHWHNLVPIMKKSPALLLFIMLIALSVTSVAAPPPTPTGLCLQSSDSTQCASSSSSSSSLSTIQSGVFPGTNLKFRPGFVVDNDEGTSTPAALESAWQAFFTASPNRKVSYRPPGIYGGLIFRRQMKLYYNNENVRPKNPADHKDPNYNWSALDAAFNINAVQNEGALIVLALPNIVTWSTTNAMPAWLIDAPYDGMWITSGPRIAKLYRYSGPDDIGRTNIGTAPYVVDELLMFAKAMYDHLVATGNIDKVMYVRTSESEPQGTPPADYNKTDYYHGFGVLVRGIAKIFAASNIWVTQSSMTGDAQGLDIRWMYMNTPKMGQNFPDMKMNGTADFTSPGRFLDRNGVYQKDLRFLAQATEANGHRVNTTFAAGVPNPWGYSNVTVPQTFSHIVWALSGAPKATDPAKRDSGLGQVGEDPPGVMPVHNLVIIWGNTYGANAPTLDEVHKAIDTFGPPGTFAFPYLPPGYVP
jgi:hypothetical protein